MSEAPSVPTPPATPSGGPARPKPYRTRVTLGIRSWRQLPELVRLTLPLFDLFRRARGARRLDVGAIPLNRRFTSFSAWDDPAAAEAYGAAPSTGRR